MSERTSSKPGIADYVVARRKRKECFLDEIDRLIDWNPLEKLLRKTLKRVVNAVGNPAYSPLPMFKILLLQRWYNLSPMGNPPALPGDLKSLTYAGVEESLSIREQLKVSDGEAFDEVCIKSMPYDVGLQVSHRVDTEVSSKSAFW